MVKRTKRPVAGCPQCAGTGVRPGDDAKQECGGCWGTGVVYRDTREPATKADAGTGTFPDSVVLLGLIGLGAGSLYGAWWVIEWVRSLAGH